MEPITNQQLFEIEREIDKKLSRIELLDDNNSFENDEIIILKDEVQNLLSYLRRVSKINRIALSGLRLV
ncbi:hypothetical protein OAT67_00775 [Bacteriovoracaceae bacterium]|nr:hypothetical protein [Bacteriovoracaceae bacterium]